MPRMTSSILEFLQTPVVMWRAEKERKKYEWIMRSKPLLGYRELCAQVRQWVKKVICVWCLCVGDGLFDGLGWFVVLFFPVQKTDETKSSVGKGCADYYRCLEESGWAKN